MATSGGRDEEADLELPLVSAARFAELYDQNERAVLSYFYRRTGCAQTAADLAAETFAAAFASRRRYHDQGAPATAWLFTIARRQLSHFARRQRVSEKARRRMGAQRVVLDDDALTRVERLVDLEPLRDALVDAVRQLPDGVARAVDLRIQGGLPYAEIAALLGCTEGAARVRVSRGLSALADRVEEYR